MNKRIALARGRERRVKAGHLWVYAGEIASVEEGAEPGDTVDVSDHKGRFLGRGYYNPASTIAVRLLTRDSKEPLDTGLLRRRVAQAIAYRRHFYAAGESCRLVFGEGDLLPGLTVDRYGPALALQISTLGMDRMRDDIVAALQDAVHPRGIYERSDLPTRQREGLEARTGLLLGEVPDEIEISLDEMRFLVRPRAGQKTGMYLDHRFNRRALQPLARGRRVLDVFCNSGSFGLYALKAGAERCTGIEISPECLEVARRNASLNDMDSRCEWVEGNAFDHLKELDRRQERFGLIVLDPPAFTKSARALDAAVRGYKEINLRAFKLAAPGALLVTSSCSYHLGPEEFLAVLQDAASDAGRDVSLVEMRGQAPDHPVHLFVPETRYLKCAILLVRN
ncbi:MAG TPA: class I SAM-dependent rRNA methyltransferase [Candidatus Polarisedimenticolia bacterium]|jgi:23S rRNA (cytosine1962-C5)-methyltransferase|nr:class I SAM-dependent rRNA methyltransferase [Candidatus Polarisedimenticolia bacterium]